MTIIIHYPYRKVRKGINSDKFDGEEIWICSSVIKGNMRVRMRNIMHIIKELILGLEDFQKMIKFYLKKVIIQWCRSPKTGKPFAENVLLIRVARCRSTKRARKVLLPKEEEGTTWSKLVMVDKRSLSSERKLRLLRKWHWSIF